MPDNAVARRTITVTTVFALFVAVTALSPVLVLLGGVIDATRWLVDRRRGMAIRSLAFLWVYLLGQLWALLALLGTAILPGRAKTNATYRLQDRWAGWNLNALIVLFSIDVDIDGGECVLPGPIVVLSRHASMVDTLLPARYVARPAGLRLRYVLKRELLVDPALDIAGNRLPNAFIDRRSREGSERQVIKSLAESLGPDDGILIYPEGTRFSTTKLRREQRRMSKESGVVGTTTAGFRRVLPPRPGGTLALLDATVADVVVLAHRGLEGLATVREIWSGSLVGSRISVKLWRVPRSEIPTERSDRVDWLYRLWAEIDTWVVGEIAAGESPA